MSEGGSVVGLTFDATRRLAGVRLDGRGQGRARVVLALPRPRPRPARHPGQPGLRRPAQDAGRQGDPRASRTSSRCGTTAPRSAGTTPTTSRPPRPSCALLSRPLPGHHRRDRARRRRLPRDGRLRSRPIASPGDLARRAAGPRGPQPLLPARRDQADARHQRARGGLRGDRAAVRPAGSGCATPGRARRTRASGSGSRCGGRPAGAGDRDRGRARRGSRSGCGRPPTRTGSWWPSRGATASAPQAMGQAVAEVLDALPDAPTSRRRSSAAAERVAARRAGRQRRTRSRPKVPVVAVTGTNGKTTTSRMIAHIARTAGRLVGWSNTDGIYIDGELVEAGDYSGPERRRPGAGAPGGEFAVTETARGGILLKGIGLTRNDVSVVTNVTADHLGPAGHRHPRPARRGQGASCRGSPARAAGRCSTATTRGCFAMRSDDQGAAVGVLAATPTRRRSARRSTTAAGPPR